MLLSEIHEIKQLQNEYEFALFIFNRTHGISQHLFSKPQKSDRLEALLKLQDNESRTTLDSLADKNSYSEKDIQRYKASISAYQKQLSDYDKHSRSKAPSFPAYIPEGARRLIPIIEPARQKQINHHIDTYLKSTPPNPISSDVLDDHAITSQTYIIRSHQNKRYFLRSHPKNKLNDAEQTVSRSCSGPVLKKTCVKKK